MRLAIVNISGGGFSGGYKKYLNELLPRLASSNQIDKILCAIPNTIAIEELNLSSEKILIFKCKPFRLIFNKDKKLIKKLNYFNPDIIFVPLARKLKFKSIPVINLIQNMEPFISNNNPLNSFKKRTQLFIQKHVGFNALKKADGVICLSKFVYDLFNQHPLNKYRVLKKIVYHGVDVNGKNDLRSLSQSKYKIKSNSYFFSAGSILPSRGIEDTILALNHLKMKKINMQVLHAGNVVDKSYFKFLKKIIKNKGLGENIIFLGKINQHEMNWYYRNSIAFIMTSRVESFGMIAAQALANGCINISTDSKCLPEIFGRCALYYDANNYIKLADRIINVLDLSSEQVKQFSNNSINQSKNFSWDICANKTIELFKEVLIKYENKR